MELRNDRLISVARRPFIGSQIVILITRRHREWRVRYTQRHLRRLPGWAGEGSRQQG